MITLRPADERGITNLGWLDSRHTFSFADYRDPSHVHYRALRVINDDRIAPGGGFPTHPHRDMEIVTIVLSGALEHKDSLGNGSVIRPAEVQRMTAGTGILHSEFNPSEDKPVHLLQIWILPDRHGLTPSYEQTAFPDAERHGKLLLVASNDGRDGSVTINQDASVYVTHVSPGESARLEVEPDRHIWVQVATGSATLNGTLLNEGDGAAMSTESAIELTGASDSEVVVFDLA
jgi:quercetin 2,3-dioxygenase